MDDKEVGRALSNMIDECMDWSFIIHQLVYINGFTRRRVNDAIDELLLFLEGDEN